MIAQAHFVKSTITLLVIPVFLGGPYPSELPWKVSEIVLSLMQFCEMLSEDMCYRIVQCTYLYVLQHEFDALRFQNYWG